MRLQLIEGGGSVKGIYCRLSQSDLQFLEKMANLKQISLSSCASELLNIKLVEEMEKLSRLLGEEWEDR